MAEQAQVELDLCLLATPQLGQALRELLAVEGVPRAATREPVVHGHHGAAPTWETASD